MKTCLSSSRVDFLASVFSLGGYKENGLGRPGGSSLGMGLIKYISQGRKA